MEESKICKFCGADCSADYKFCPSCGASLEDSKCPKCGEKIIEGAKFCVSCGASLAKSDIANADSDTVVNENCDERLQCDESAIDISKASEPVKKEKQFKSKSEKSGFIIRIIKNAAMLVLCAILFGLSFGGVVKVNMDSYIDINGVEGCDVTFSSVDIISIMGASAEADSGKDNKYSDEMIDLEERMIVALKNDYNSKLDKYVLSAKTKAIISDYAVCYFKYMMTMEDTNGSPTYNNLIIAGVFCLMNVLFAAAMFIVSVVSLVLVVLKKKNRVTRYLYAMPVYLFISMLILFIVKTTFGVATSVAAAMCASIFFEIIALLLTVILVFMASKGKPIKNAIPKLISLGMSLIICACLFAPVLTAKYDLVLNNRTYAKTYSVAIGAGGLITYISPSQAEEYDNELPSYVYNESMEQVEIVLESMSELTLYEFEKEGGKTATYMIIAIMLIGIGEYNLIGALSAGYYVLLVVFMLFAAMAIWSVATLFKNRNRASALLATALVLIILALACSIGWICILNYNLDGYDLSFTVGGGLIAALLLSIITLITTEVLTSVLSRKKAVKSNASEEIISDSSQSIA